MADADDGDRVPQALVDSIVAGIWQTAAQNGHYDGLRRFAGPVVAREADAAIDRHAAAQRAAGVPGW
jgi:hypothetical protein